MTSFPVVLLHPPQHAGLSLRSPVCRQSRRDVFEPASFERVSRSHTRIDRKTDLRFLSMKDQRKLLSLNLLPRSGLLSSDEE